MEFCKGEEQKQLEGEAEAHFLLQLNSYFVGSRQLQVPQISVLSAAEVGRSAAQNKLLCSSSPYRRAWQML